MSPTNHVEDIYVLTPMQKGILFHSFRSPDASLYFEQLVWTIEQRLDTAAFQQAWQRVLERHTILRTSFLWEGLDEPVQVVSRHLELPFEEHDFRSLSTAERQQRFSSLLAADRKRGFDPSVPPLMRLLLIRMQDEVYRFVWSHHHLLLDGWSYPLILKEVIACYEALTEARQPELPAVRPFRDYISWMRQKDLSAAESFWRSSLAGFTKATPLTVDRFLPEHLSQDEEYAQEEILLSAQTTLGLKALVERHHLTLNACVQGAWAQLLSRYSGETDIVFGIIVSGRTPMLKGSESMVGLFLNNVPLRVRIDPQMPLLDALKVLHAQQFEIFQHEHCGLPQIQEWSEVPRGEPLFDSYLTFQNYPSTEFYRSRQKSLSFRDLEFSIRTGYPITLLAGLLPQFGVRITYDRRRFDAATCARMMSHLGALLEGMIADPQCRVEQLPLLSAAQCHQLLSEWNDTRDALPQGLLLHELVEAQATRTPEAVAVEFEEKTLSYRELDERSNQLAHELRDAGVAPEVVVGLYLDRCLELVVGLLGVLKAGGAYLPLDPAYPAARLGFMVEDARAQIVLTREQHLEGLPAGAFRVVSLDTQWPEVARHRRDKPPLRIREHNLAYVIYTSGSTGQPKGAMNTHRAISNRLLWMQETYRLGARDRVVQKTPFSFDVSVWEFFLPLMAGARLVLARPGGHRDGAYLVRLLRERKITVMHFVPSMLQLFLAEKGVESCRSLRQVICSGEALPFELQKRFFQRSHAALDNLYGPTEAAVDVTFWPCQRHAVGARVPIGRPISNLHLLVLDAKLRPLPVGVPGELHIGGVGLARGYLQRPALSAERFIPSVVAGEPGARLYKTGDLVRLLPDGSIEYLARLDHQVKIRGLRIELGEIEAALLQHPAVREAVVLAREDLPGDRRLVAYLVADPGRPAPTVGEVQRFLKDDLPDYMVPAMVVALAEMPLSANGKVNRRALPQPAGDRPQLEEALVEPRTEVERELVAIWQQVLGVERLGVRDNFFTLGGDSMRSLQVLAKAREQNLEFSLERFISRPTVEQLAQEVTRGGEAAGSYEPQLEPFALIPEEDRQRLPAGVEDAYPLTRLQAGMLFHGDYSEQSSAYHDVFSYRIDAPCEPEPLRQALAQLVGRHPVLRTAFDMTRFSQPLQLVYERCEIPLTVEDLRALGSEEQEKAVNNWIREEKKRHFDWQRPPLFRVRIDCWNEESFRFTFSFHHAILDGWSMAALVRELMQLYRAALKGESPALELAPETGFRDFVALELEALRSEPCRDFWRQQLAALPEGQLPRYPRYDPAATAGHDRKRPALDLSPLVEGLRATAQLAHAPLKSVLLAAHLRVLGTLGSQPEVVSGLAVNNRLETVGGESVLGVLLSVLPLRLRFSGLSWLDLVRQSFEAEQLLLPFRRFPLAEMSRMTEGASLFQTVFNFTHFYVLEVVEEEQDLGLAGEHFFEETNFTLVANFSLSPDSQRLYLVLEFDPEALCTAQVQAIEGYYREALTALAQDPFGHYPAHTLMSPGERSTVLSEWNATRSEYPRQSSVHELFELRARRHPEQIALDFDSRQMTYGELDAAANRLAHHLRDLGVGPETAVGISLERSPEMIVALLGTLKAGGVYVPLDPNSPRDRSAFMLDDAQVRVIVTQESQRGDLPATQARVVSLDRDASRIRQRSAHKPSGTVSADQLAYVIYTSGSTGRPKGAAVVHRAIARLVLGTNYVRFGPEDRIAQASNAAFDAATFEIWGALLNGARLVGLSREVILSPQRFAERVGGGDVNTLFLTPALFNQLAREVPQAFARLRYLVLGGEALDAQWLREVLTHGAPEYLINGYGPTECTTFAVTYTVDAVPAAATTVPIGRPIANTTAYVLDRRAYPVGVGVAGELCLGGDGLVRGYFQRPRQTAEKFIPNPFSDPLGERLYRTGDLVRFLPNGEIFFLGRIDFQVKLRGFRIELGEIETALARHPAVRHAVALVREDSPGDRRLVAYLVRDADVDDAELVADLRRDLTGSLPQYMVPAAFVPLRSLPLNANGKLDRRALPAPDWEPAEGQESYVMPGTESEKKLADIFSRVLGVERVGIEDNFFDLGGDSILSIQVVARAREAGLRVTPRQIFEQPTLAELAQVSETLAATRHEQETVTGPVPMTPIQRWFLALDWQEPHHFNQSFFLELRQRLDPEILERAWRQLLSHHDALRLRFVEEQGSWRSFNAAPDDEVPFLYLDFTACTERWDSAVSSAVTALQRSLDLEHGPLARMALFELDDAQPQRLLLVIHHLVVDAVSWRILLEDLELLCGQISVGQPPRLPAKTSSFQQWARQLVEYARSAQVAEELEFWLAMEGRPAPQLPIDDPRGVNTVAATEVVTVELAEEPTRALLQEVPQAYNTRINEVLLTALAEAFGRWTKERSLRVHMEGHGREELFANSDLSRTVGWFTSIFPVQLELPPHPLQSAGEALKAVKEQLRKVPRSGIGYGVLRYLNADRQLQQRLEQSTACTLSFNYLGQFDQTFTASALVRFTGEPGGSPQSPLGIRPYLLDVIAAIFEGRLQVSFNYSRSLHQKTRIEGLARDFIETLEALIGHCLAPDAGGYTPSDFPDVAMSEEQLNSVLAELGVFSSGELS